MLVFNIHSVKCERSKDTDEVIAVLVAHHPLDGGCVECAGFRPAPYEALLLSARLKQIAACIIAAAPSLATGLDTFRNTPDGRKDIPP